MTRTVSHEVTPRAAYYGCWQRARRCMPRNATYLSSYTIHYRLHIDIDSIQCIKRAMQKNAVLTTTVPCSTRFYNAPLTHQCVLHCRMHHSIYQNILRCTTPANLIMRTYAK